ncbi:MAG: heterocyst frequency control protein PatD [Cyanobacteria bacterium P01_C01_bin.120]
MSGSQDPDKHDVDILTTFITQLKGLQTMTQSSNIDGRSLQQHFLAVQQLYQTQILPLMMTSSAAADFVSYQTEINRALRLLGLDVAFLQSAKQSVTQQKRQAQMLKRLNTLLEFCQGLKTALSVTKQDS